MQPHRQSHAEKALEQDDTVKTKSTLASIVTVEQATRDCDRLEPKGTQSG